MEAKKAIARDWSSLLPEVLNLIAKGLREVSDFVRFRAVCKAWRSSTHITDLPPQFPWILESNFTSLNFHSVSTGKIYNTHAINYAGQLVHEMTGGHLLFVLRDIRKSITESFILNPLNNHKIPLPTCDNYYPNWFRQRQNQIGEYGFCSKLARRNSKCPKLILCRLGLDHWFELKLDFNDSNYKHFYLNGMLFSLERETGVTKVVDISNGTPSYIIPPVEGYSTAEKVFHILEASGDILVAFGRYNEHRDLLYEIHRLDAIKIDSPCWVKVNNIGNHALFMDMFGGFMLKADDMAGIRANCIYYFEQKYVTTLLDYIIEMVRMDIKTGTKERRVCPRSTLEDRGGWFVPNLCRVGWFVPNLCRLQTQ